MLAMLFWIQFRNQTKRIIKKPSKVLFVENLLILKI